MKEYTALVFLFSLVGAGAFGIACGTPNAPPPVAAGTSTSAAPSSAVANAEPASPPAASSSADAAPPVSPPSTTNATDDPMAPLPKAATAPTVETPGIVGEAVTVSGRLHPTRIQAKVRAEFPAFLGCYQAGVAKHPGVAGRVRARFTIARDGSVTDVVDHGSDLPDRDIVTCVLKIFGEIRFQAPAAGIVTVTYPLAFSKAP